MAGESGTIVPLTFHLYQDGQLVRTEALNRDVVKIGSHAGSHLRIENDDGVSRIHAVVDATKGVNEVELIDLDSTNGTIVNGKRINKCILQTGHEILIGNTKLVVEIGQASGVDVDEEAPTSVAQASGVPMPAVPAAPMGASPVPPAPMANSPIPPPAAAPPVGGISAAPPAPAPSAAIPEMSIEEANLSTEAMFSMAGDIGGVEAGNLEVTGAAATEVVAMWGGSALGVKHFPHTSTYGSEKHITTRGESIIAGTCMVMGGVVLGPVVGNVVRRIYHPQVVTPASAYTLGEDPKSDIWVTQELLGGGTRVALVEADAQGSRLNILAGMTGEVTLPDGTRQDLLQFAQGQSSLAVPAGARIRCNLGEFTFLVNSVLPGRLPVIPTDTDWATVVYTGFSFLVHAVFMFLVYFIPPDPRSLSLDMLAEDNRFVRYILEPPEIQQEEIEDWVNQDNQDDEQGGKGKRHKGEEGQMGRQDAKKSDNRFGIKGPADNPDPHMARERAKEYAASGGILAALQSNAPTSPFGQDSALGNDPESALGALMGNQIGDNFGYGGLGLRGTGRGGGGTGEGTIGLGNLNTIGHGGGGGSGSGYGRGSGGLRGRRASVPQIRTGTAAVRGSLSKEVIRRYIRRHINQIRYCYEQQLARRPDLSGRVAVRFVISPSGAVSTASVAGSTLGNPAAEQCVARAVQRIAFPQPEGGGVVIVTYPFMFQSASGS